MRIGMLDSLGFDQPQTTKMITWGNGIEVPMVPTGYWTERCIQALCSRKNTEKRESENINQNEEMTAHFTTEPTIFSRPMTHSLQVSQKQSTKHQISSKSWSVMESIWRPSNTRYYFEYLPNMETYSREAKGITLESQSVFQLKPNTVLCCAKPYTIPVKNWEAMEDKFEWQCNIGALRHLTLEEFEEREWACPAFGIPKKNRTIQLIIDLRQINSNLIWRKYCYVWPQLATRSLETKNFSSPQ